MTSRVGFRPERLQLARQFRKLTLTEVGAAIGYSPQYISNIEKGRREPPVDLVQAFGAVLRFDANFFMRDVGDRFCEPECSFRKKASTPNYESDHLLAWGTLLAELYEHLRSEVELPEVDVPRYKVDSVLEAERAAEKARIYWGLGLEGPLARIGRVIERAGVPLFFVNTPGQQVDAFARWGRTPAVLANRAKDSTSRLRFDLAHETGHLVMHQDDMSQTQAKERQAHRFASAFLMPAPGFTHQFNSLGGKSWAHLLELKKQWKVSLAAIVRRAKDLGLIDEAEYVRRNQYIRAKGWHRAEPAEPEEEQPELLTLAVVTVSEELGRSLDDVADEVGWAATTFEEITGIPVSSADAETLNSPDVIPLERFVS